MERCLPIGEPYPGHYHGARLHEAPRYTQTSKLHTRAGKGKGAEAASLLVRRRNSVGGPEKKRSVSGETRQARCPFTYVLPLPGPEVLSRILTPFLFPTPSAWRRVRIRCGNLRAAPGGAELKLER